MILDMDTAFLQHDNALSRSCCRIGRKTLLIVALFAHLLTLPPLWAHESDSALVLGRYSLLYAAAVILHLVLTVLWLLVWLLRNRLDPLIRKINPVWRYAAVTLSGTVIIALWFTGVEGVLKEGYSISWLFASLLLLYDLPDRGINLHRWRWALIAGALVVLLLMFAGTLTPRGYSPDEATYLDQALTPFVGEPPGVYDRLWLETPYAIYPGHGWMIALYGWLQHTLSPNILIGRVWNFLGYLAAFAGIALVTNALYGCRSAVLSLLFVMFSLAFVPVYDFRPSHQLATIGVWIVFVALAARRASSPAVAGRLHFLCGLLATLALQVHAGGIVFAFGMSLFYVAEYLLNVRRLRRLVFSRTLLWYGLGAVLGSLVFYTFNVLAGGGLEIFLSNLIEERGADYFVRGFYPYDWPSLFEKVVIWSALAYLIWRRLPSDRLLLGVTACILTGELLLDTQGYASTYNFLFVIPVGALLVDDWGAATYADKWNRRGLWATACVFAILVAQAWTTMVTPDVWNWLRTGTFPPYLYEELRPILQERLRADDRIVSTHQLLWTFPESRQLVSYAAEPTAMRRWNLQQPIAVWEQVQPTVVIYVPEHMSLNPGLQEYMAKYAFQMCERLEVVGYRVEIFRSDCAISP